MRQEVYLDVLKKIDTFKGESLFSTWLTSVAYNRCVSHYRKARQVKRITEDIPVQNLERKTKVDFEDDIATHELAERLMKIVPERHRGLLDLYYLHGRSIRELAEYRGTSELALRMTLHRMRKAVYALAKQHKLVA